MKTYLPDVNVWVALNHDLHAHQAAANLWYKAVPTTDRIAFCRQTQLSLFRILSTHAIMADGALSMNECWKIFGQWIGTGQVDWAEEPGGIERCLRDLTSKAEIAPKAWNDLYLAAFAEAAGLTLVTFDKALAGKTKGAVLLG